MPIFPASLHALPGRDIVIGFVQNKRPIRADELGKLFSTLARDYRQLFPGRELVVMRVRPGSLYTVLRDSFRAQPPSKKNTISDAEATKSIENFARTLKIRFEETRERSIASEPADGQIDRQAGQASVETIFEIAAKSDSELVMAYARTPRNRIEVNFTFLEVRRANRAIISDRRRRRRPPEPKAARIAEELMGASAQEIDALVSAIVAALRRSGLHFALKGIADELAKRGRIDLALKVRAAIGEDESEPPLTVR
jgi:hypothetical protein